MTKNIRGIPKHYRKSALRRNRPGKEPLSFRELKGIPRFHAKSAGYFSYRTACQYPKKGNALKRPTIRLKKNILYLPKLKHGVELIIHRKLPEDARILNATVIMDTDGTYQVSICYSYTFLMEMNCREVLAYKLWKKEVVRPGLTGCIHLQKPTVYAVRLIRA